jgi:hypothetical protein
VSIHIKLTTERKYRNKHEYFTYQVASCVVDGQEFSTKGDGFIIERLCKKVLDSNPRLGHSLVEVTRDSREVFTPANLDYFASGKHYRGGEQPEQLKRKQK